MISFRNMIYKKDTNPATELDLFGDFFRRPASVRVDLQKSFPRPIVRNFFTRVSFFWLGSVSFKVMISR